MRQTEWNGMELCIIYLDLNILILYYEHISIATLSWNAYTPFVNGLSTEDISELNPISSFHIFIFIIHQRLVLLVPSYLIKSNFFFSLKEPLRLETTG